MKEGWTYKTLEEVCNINYGTRVVQKKDKGTTYYVYGGGGATFMIDRYNREDCFIVSRFAMSPKCTRFVKGKFFLNDSGLSVSTNHDNLNQRYLDKALLANNDNIYSMGKGLAQRNLDMPSFRKLIIPIPPLAEQERIVAELDLLSSIIEKKKAQLKELDQLAQSIFYTMFGDPITNEKAWEVKKLKEVSTLINGRAYKQNELLNEGKYKVLRVGNFFTNSNYYYSDLELEDNKYCDNGDLLFAWSASFGAFIWCGEKVIYHYHIWKVLYDEKQLNKIFYCNLLNTMTNAFMNDVHGIGMVHLTKQGMEDYILPLPPLPLQQEFASKIEAIERQKSLIQQSIVETQTLFDSRMDHWFG